MNPSPKSILIVGAYGFIGSALAHQLSAAGHDVTGFGRNISYGRSILPHIQWRQGDLGQFCDSQKWANILQDMDVVINASGVLQSSPGNDVNTTQAKAIIALAKACEQTGLSRFIQISACGASDQAPNDFMQSKAQADRYLQASSLHATILRPGLVIGRNSYGGTELIRMVAALPCIAPRLTKVGKVHTISLSDVVDAVSRAVESPEAYAGTYDLVEEEPQSLDQVIARHREWFNLAPARWNIPVNLRLIKLTAIISDGLGWFGWRSPMRRNALQSMIAGVEGDAVQTAELLGRPALPLDRILGGFPSGKQDRIHARLMLALPLFLTMLVLLWLGSGILGLLKLDEAADLLAQSQLSRPIAEALVISGALADIVLSLGLTFRKTARLALSGTIMVSLAYLLGGTIFTPELWLDPLAPLIKTLATIGLSITCLIALDKR